MTRDLSKEECKSLFDKYNGERSTSLDRAELCSKLTIPYLFMEESATVTTDFDRLYSQGYGAKLVNHLVGKFALSILPPSTPFFRLSPTQEAMDAIAQGNADMQHEIEKVLAQKEDGIMRYINKSKFRASLYPALRIAMVTGDSLIENIEGVYRVFNMRNYVIKRDYSGAILDLIIKEKLDFDAVPEDIRNTLDEKLDNNSKIELYTRTYLDDGAYYMYQEIDGKRIEEPTKIKDITDNYISVRWTKIDGEDYGRGFIEEHLGTLIALEKQLEVINQSAIIASKAVFTVNPNGMTKYKDYVKATNGDVIIGDANDIGVVRVDKARDMQTTYAIVQDYKRELAESFLITGSSIRDAERVTAHEVQLVASELEASFGGIYTAISEDIQIPLVQNAMNQLKIKTGKDVDVIITAGVEALGRNVELNKINILLQELGSLGQLVGAEKVAETINVYNITSAMVANSGVAGKNFVYSQREIEEKQAMAQQQAIEQQMLMTGGNQLASNMANDPSAVEGANEQMEGAM